MDEQFQGCVDVLPDITLLFCPASFQVKFCSNFNEI